MTIVLVASNIRMIEILCYGFLGKFIGYFLY
jgi:hypothetical protein